MQFILDSIVIPLVSSFFIVVGGALPIAILIYIFSKKEKRRLLWYAEQVKDALPLQEQLKERMFQLTQHLVGSQDVNQSLDSFSKLIEAQNTIDEQKKFIKYAENYDFISAVGHVLRVSNYMPKGINEHKEISKNLPDSL